MRISDWSSDVCSSDHVRGHCVDGDRPQWRQAGLLENDRRFALAEMRPIGDDMWRHQPCGAGLGAQLLKQFLGRAVRGEARIALIGNDGFPTATLYLRRNRFRALGHLPSPIIMCRSEEHTSGLQSLMRISYAVLS